MHCTMSVPEAGTRLRPESGILDSGSGIAKRVAHDLVCRTLVRQVAEVLAPAGIPLMPLKGVLLARWVYETPWERLGSDVDLLVPAPRFEAAIGALRAAGFAGHVNPLHPCEATLDSSWAPVPVDLHKELFGPGRYRLTSDAVFARGRPDRDLFDVPVMLPDPLDALAHAVGHAASDHTRDTAVQAGRDVARLAARFAIDPARAAAHLDACGLGRASRYALGLCAREVPFARSVLERLRPDLLGDLLAGTARALVSRVDPGTLWGRGAGLLTNDSLARSAAIAARVATGRQTEG
jgi:hypothetical protein